MSSLQEAGRVLFIDAYDSFSENIAAMLSQILSVEVTMIHIDTHVDDLLETPSESMQDNLARFLQRFDAVVLGPGPGNPNHSADVGLFSHIWKLRQENMVPVLGICLGFQSLCVTHGASISRLPEPCHGHAKKINHCAQDIFTGVGEVLATNYNSLQVKLTASLSKNSGPQSPTASQSGRRSNFSFAPFPTCARLKPLAWDDVGTLMAVSHVELPYWGLQFHPESCKSSASCQKIIQNWWQASMNWSNHVRSATTLPPRLLPAGHVWSRPLTPVSANAAPGDLTEHHGDISTLYEYLMALTTSSGGSVHTRSCRLAVRGSVIADFCRRLSPATCTMLESTRKGRYSIYAFPSPGRYHVEYGLQTSICAVYNADQERREWKMSLRHLLDHIHRMVADRRADGGHEPLPFWAGLIGFFSYEVGLDNIGVRPSHRQASPDFPDVSLLWVERCIVVDHFADTAYVQSICHDDSVWISEIAQKLCSLPHSLNPSGSDSRELQTLQTVLASAETVMPDQDSYKRKIQSCQSYLHAGDSYELCLTTEAQITMPPHPENSWLLYQNLRRHNPVPFSAFLCLGKTTILSSSPEQFLTWDRSTGTIDMVPMKGTVAKSPTMTLERASEILASPKESAENLMIADLIRHDLYSTVGWNASVEVVKLCQVVEHETVYQLVSHIRATPTIPAKLSPPPSSSSSPSPSPSAASPSPSCSSSDDRHRQVTCHGHKALRQTLPPGSMTGAPKKRSCEILDRLEQRRRGPYSGLIGYLDAGGGGGFSVCIRTAVSHADDNENCRDADHHSSQSDENGNRKDGSNPNPRRDDGPGGGDESKRQRWHIGAGGAITVLSDPDAEWEEMKTKLDSVLKAFRPDR